jgi:hypothetical protein
MERFFFLKPLPRLGFGFYLPAFGPFQFWNLKRSEGAGGGSDGGRGWLVVGGLPLHIYPSYPFLPYLFYPFWPRLFWFYPFRCYFFRLFYSFGLCWFYWFWWFDLVVLVVLGVIVNNLRLYCKFFVSFSGLVKCLIIRGKVSGFSGKTLL